MHRNALTLGQLGMNPSRKIQWLAMASMAVLLVTSECCGSEVYSATVAQQVYECRLNGQRIFSDQPCADDATKRKLTPSNTMQAQEAEIGYRALPSKSHQRKASREAPDAHDKQRERCAKLGNDKQNISSRLRAGYNNNQGERLRDRLRKIDAEYYDLRCSSLH